MLIPKGKLYEILTTVSQFNIARLKYPAQDQSSEAQKLIQIKGQLKVSEYSRTAMEAVYNLLAGMRTLSTHVHVSVMKTGKGAPLCAVFQ